MAASLIPSFVLLLHLCSHPPHCSALTLADLQEQKKGEFPSRDGSKPTRCLPGTMLADQKHSQVGWQNGCRRFWKKRNGKDTHPSMHTAIPKALKMNSATFLLLFLKCKLTKKKKSWLALPPIKEERTRFGRTLSLQNVCHQWRIGARSLEEGAVNLVPHLHCEGRLLEGVLKIKTVAVTAFLKPHLLHTCDTRGEKRGGVRIWITVTDTILNFLISLLQGHPCL